MGIWIQLDHFDADPDLHPDSNFYMLRIWMRIWFRLVTLMGMLIQIQVPNADPDPHH
jgi:hypothetical protein